MTLLSNLIVDQAAATDFWGSDRVRPVIDTVANELLARDVTVLLAVSPEGHRVVGALSYARPGVFSVWRRGDNTVPALVDGVTASLLAAQDVASRFQIPDSAVTVVLEAPGFDRFGDTAAVTIPLDGGKPRRRLAAV